VLQRRLAKVEKVLAETAEEEKPANCICIPCGKRFNTIAFSNKPKEFEADMNLRCPAHGFRSLGHVMVFRVIGLCQ
jgi:DNA-directed RNA polymerase subunit RPC12/RpoP